MSLSPNLPQAAVDMVVALLLPLILPGLNGDIPAARALALHMLSEYHPQSVLELRFAGEAIGFSLKSLASLARSAEPGISPETLDNALKWACSLSRSGHQAQRRLNDLQRPPRGKRQAEPAQEAAPAVEAAAETPPATQAADAGLDAALAEATFETALKVLNLMKAQYKGAPPPHSQAAQQIQAQQRVVETARLKLQQARNRQAQAERRADPVPAAA